MKTLFVFVLEFVAGLAFAQQQPQEGQQGWFKQESGTTEGLERVQFFTPTTGWACGSNGNAYHTTDAGESWTQFPPPPQYFEYLYFVDDTTAIAVGETPDGVHSRIMTTYDRGQTWYEEYQDEQWSGPVDATHMGDTILALFENWVFKSIDRGKTWKKFFFNDFSYMNCIDCRDSKHCYIGGDRGVFAYSVDGGEYFTQMLNVPPSVAGVDLNDVTVLPNGRIFAVGSVRTLMYSDNSGVSWDTIPKLDEVKVTYRAVDFADSLNGLVVGSRGFIYRTTDGGLNWEVQSDGGHGLWLEDVYMQDSLTAWATGISGLVLHTTDAGKSWVAPNLPGLETITSQIFPNPSIGILNFNFTMPSPQYVTLEILSMNGTVVQHVMLNEYFIAGEHTIPIDGRGLAAGPYLCRLTSATYTSIAKFTKIVP